MPVSPPFDIDTSAPAASDNISAFPANEQANRDVIESWLTFISDPATGLIKSTALPTSLTLVSLTTGALTVSNAGNPVLTMFRNDGTPEDNDFVTVFSMTGKNDAGETLTYAQITGRSTDVSDGTEDGDLRFNVQSNGVFTNVLSLTGTTGTISVNTTIGGSLTVGGPITSTGAVTASQNFVSSTGNVVIGNNNTAGGVFLRPNGAGSATGQFVVGSTGNITVTGNATIASSVTANNSFSSSTSTVILATTGAGNVALRPNGAGSVTNQAVLNSSGTFSAVAFVGDGSGLTGIDPGVPPTRTLTAGAGLTGGGDLSANRSFAVDGTVWRDANPPTSSQIDALYPSALAGSISGSWVSISRTQNVWYQNTFGKAIILRVTAGTGPKTGWLSPDGGTFAYVAARGTTDSTDIGSDGTNAMYMYVPAGMYYRYNTTASGYSTFEYR